MRKIRIAGKTYTIVADPGLHVVENDMGSCQNATLQINVCTTPQYDDAVVVQTLAHEILHAVAHCWKRSISEEDVDALSEGVIQILGQFVDLKDVVAWLKESGDLPSSNP